MANKFLGINSINVIKDYVDQKVAQNSGNLSSSFITLHAYKYVKDNGDNSRPATPVGGSFEYIASNVTYPTGWSSLYTVLNELSGAVESLDYENIDKALSEGSIWLSVGVIEGENSATDINWSIPMKISGQNGVSVRFAYSYDPNATEEQRTKYPSGVSIDNRTEYVWTKYADEAWQGPTIWATYSVDATIVIWRYCLSKGIGEDNLPIDATPWVLDIPSMSMNSEYPYMWMSYKIIPAKETIITEEQSNINNSENSGWSTPVVFGHYAKDGENGTLPDYNINIYRLGEGLYTPEKPVWEENISVEDFRANNPDWVDLPVKIEKEPEIDENAIYVNSVEDLLNTINSGEAKTIALNDNINLEKAIVITSDVTIELNGKTITCGTFTELDGEMLEGGKSDSYVFWVKNGGNLTINDITGKGKVIAQEANYSIAVWVNGGEATINGGNYYNAGDNCDLIYVSKSGKVTINGGYFEAAEMITPGVGTGYKRSALNIKNADIDNCEIVVNGGSFLEFNPANLDKEVGGITSFVSPNCISTNSDGNNFVVVVDPTTVDPDLWWQCVLKIEGKTGIVLSTGDVHRYNAIDGEALPGQFTKYEFCWSNDQNLPKNPEWTDQPKYVESDQEGSLWMRMTDVKMINGKLQILKNWSTPIKLTGPRGPIAYDYRLEIRYNIGTETKPRVLPTEEEWSKNVPEVTSKHPYIWAVNYLVLYNMKYDENGKIITADNGTLVETYSYFRLSGINGEDGNRKNSLKYFTSSEEIDVTSFSENNLYISNSPEKESVVYNIKLDQLSFINGYTGIFTNIGKGNVTINSGDDFTLVASCTKAKSIELLPQEQIELVCYNNGNSKELLVIGKALA